METRKYVVEFSIEVEATDAIEAMEIAKDGVICDDATVYVDGNMI